MLTPALTIQKKRDGIPLSEIEIREFIRGNLRGEVADYQATAFLMAVYFQGMTAEETVIFAREMLESGERYDLSNIPGPKIDKHSTGGVGDKTSIILAPLAAACGLKVPMMSGRGLGHTGGTLDKLEAISGFTTRLARSRFEEILGRVGCAMIGQSETIAPADKKFYALRDVTATVECIPLIVGSILSKKLAEGAEGLVFDVKTGSGAFMKSLSRSKLLARTLVSVAKKLGMPSRALVTDMSQPLGSAVGNALEIRECIRVLQNQKSQNQFTKKAGIGHAELKELTLVLCAQMLELGKVTKTVAEGRKLATAKLADGSAWKVFREIVIAQGGNVDQIDRPELLPQADRTLEWKAWAKGSIRAMDCEKIGNIVTALGGGRKRAEDLVDPSVGLEFHAKLGSQVIPGTPLVTVHLNRKTSDSELASLEHEFQNSIVIGPGRYPIPKLVLDPVIK